MRYAEAVAKLVLEAAIPGASMHQRDELRSGSHDFDLRVPGLADMPVEVTMATDPVLKHTTAHLMNQRSGGEFIRRHHCRQDWLVAIVRHADVRRVRADVDQYLSAIEQAGYDRFFVSADGECPAVLSIRRDLGVEAGWVTTWRTPGLIGILPPGPEGGWIDPIHVSEAVLAEARKSDNLAKLVSPQAPDRHLFVLVDLDSFRAWSALNEQQPGKDALILPQPITVAWAAAQRADHGHFTVWTARTGHPWASRGVVEIDTAALSALITEGWRPRI